MSAEDWYRRSLAISEELDNHLYMAGTMGQVGLLAEERGRLQEALVWMIRSVVLFDTFPHPATGPVPQHLARLVGQVGMATFAKSWLEVTGQALPGEIRHYVEFR